MGIGSVQADGLSIRNGVGSRGFRGDTTKRDVCFIGMGCPFSVYRLGEGVGFSSVVHRAGRVLSRGLGRRCWGKMVYRGVLADASYYMW